MPETDTYRELAARLSIKSVPTTIGGQTVYYLPPDGSVVTEERLHAIIRDRAAEALRDTGRYVEFVYEDDEVYGWDLRWHCGREVHVEHLGMPAGGGYVEALLAALDLAGIGAKP